MSDASVNSIERVDPRDRGALRAALSVVLTGRVAPRDPTVDHLLAYVATAGLSLDHVYRAGADGGGAATAVLPMPGGAAMVLVSPARGAAGPLAAAVSAAVAGLPASSRHLVQALLEPGQSREAAALRAAGFRRLAVLDYRAAVLEPPRGGVDGLAPLRERVLARAMNGATP